MPTLFQQRMTAVTDEEFVVFLIGMRINKPLKIHRWLPIARAMGQMITELNSEQGSDLLHVESWPGRTTIMVQYWKSLAALEAYAKNTNLPAWSKFNKLVNSNGDVGIWVFGMKHTP